MNLINNLKRIAKEPKQTHTNPSLGNNFFSDVLNQADTVKKDSRKFTKEYPYVHVSSLEDFCARRSSLLILHSKNIHKNITGGHRVTFAQGRAIESFVLESLFDVLGKDRFVGSWSCSCGHHKSTGLWNDSKCEKCGHGLENYKEYSLVSDEYNIVGNPDFIYIGPKGNGVIGEIKSMNKEQFSSLTAPLPEHLRQATKYYFLAKNKKVKVSKYIHFIYVQKEWKFGSPYKTFEIDASEEKYEKLFNEAVEDVKPVKNFIETGLLPERILCKSPMGSIAKQCSVVNECFKEKQ